MAQALVMSALKGKPPPPGSYRQKPLAQARVQSVLKGRADSKASPAVKYGSRKSSPVTASKQILWRPVDDCIESADAGVKDANLAFREKLAAQSSIRMEKIRKSNTKQEENNHAESTIHGIDIDENAVEQKESDSIGVAAKTSGNWEHMNTIPDVTPRMPEHSVPWGQFQRVLVERDEAVAQTQRMAEQLRKLSGALESVKESSVNQHDQMVVRLVEQECEAQTHVYEQKFHEIQDECARKMKATLEQCDKRLEQLQEAAHQVELENATLRSQLQSKTGIAHKFQRVNIKAEEENAALRGKVTEYEQKMRVALETRLELDQMQKTRAAEQGENRRLYKEVTGLRETKLKQDSWLHQAKLEIEIETEKRLEVEMKTHGMNEKFRTHVMKVAEQARIQAEADVFRAVLNDADGMMFESNTKISSHVLKLAEQARVQGLQVENDVFGKFEIHTRLDVGSPPRARELAGDKLLDEVNRIQAVTAVGDIWDIIRGNDGSKTDGDSTYVDGLDIHGIKSARSPPSTTFGEAERATGIASSHEDLPPEDLLLQRALVQFSTSNENDVVEEPAIIVATPEHLLDATSTIARSPSSPGLQNGNYSEYAPAGSGKWQAPAPLSSHTTCVEDTGEGRAPVLLSVPYRPQIAGDGSSMHHVPSSATSVAGPLGRAAAIAFADGRGFQPHVPASSPGSPVPASMPRQQRKENKVAVYGTNEYRNRSLPRYNFEAFSSVSPQRRRETPTSNTSESPQRRRETPNRSKPEKKSPPVTGEPVVDIHAIDQL